MATTATATAATAYLWRRGPAYRTSHGAARPTWVSHGTPGQNWGTHGRLRVEGGKERETLGLHRTGCVRVLICLGWLCGCWDSK